MQIKNLKRNILLNIFLFLLIIGLTFQTSGFDKNIQNKIYPQISSDENNQVIYSTSFEEKWTSNQINNYVAPLEWVIDGICSGHQKNHQELTHYWSKLENNFSYVHDYWRLSPLSPPFVYSGQFSAGIWGNDGNKESSYPKDQSDEWLISPSLDFSDFYDISLQFWSIYVPTQQISIPFPFTISVDNQYLIEVSEDNGQTWDKLADLRESKFKYGVNQIYDVYNNFDHPITIHLKKLDGKDDVRIGWHYKYEGNGTNDLWIIDNVTICGKRDIFSPAIEIVKPQINSLYLFDKNTYSLDGKTILVGSTTIKADPTDKGTGTKLVKFYVDNKLTFTDEDYPFSWEWRKPGIGTYELKTVAIDYAGNENETSIDVIKIF